MGRACEVPRRLIYSGPSLTNVRRSAARRTKCPRPQLSAATSEVRCTLLHAAAIVAQARPRLLRQGSRDGTAAQPPVHRDLGRLPGMVPLGASAAARASALD